MSFRKTVPEHVQKIFEQTFISTTDKRLNEAYQTLDPILAEVEKIDILINSNKIDDLKMKEIATHKAAIYELIKDMWTKPVGWDFLDIHADFLDGVQELAEQLPEFHKEEQSIDRFKALKSDKWHIRFKKYIKNKAYGVSTVPKKSVNWGLKIFKKTPKPIPLWSHKTPLRGVVKKVYQTDLVKSLTEKEKIKYIAFLQIIVSLKSYENNADLILTSKDDEIFLTRLSDELTTLQAEKIRNDISVNKESNLQAVAEALSLSHQHFSEVMDKANTMELSKRQLSTRKLNSRFAKINNNWLNNSVGWSRTLYVLFDDWRLDFEINRLKYFVYNALFKASKKLVTEKDKYQNSLVRVAAALEEIEKSISEKETITKGDLQVVKSNIKTNLKGVVIPEVIEKFDGKKLIGIVRSIEKELKIQIDAISESRALVKAELYGRALKEQDVNIIKPNELISFEVFQEFLKSSTRLKNSIFNQLETITKLIPDIDNIVLFSIETALNASAKEEDAINHENTQIIMDGIGRAKNRLAEVQNLIDELHASYEKNLLEAIQKFTTDAVGLTQNDNALSIRIKLLKAKALQQTKSYQNVAKGHIFKVFAIARRHSVKALARAEKNIKLLRKKYFLQPSDALITQEISKFLSESESLINELPTIYRRLYKVEPVTDMDLFMGREEEYKGVKSAYDNWLKERSSATALVGEKWGGTTSFINYVEANIDFKSPVVRVNVEEKLYDKTLLYQFIANTLSIDDVGNQKELIEAINKLQTKKILIIENIQHLYLRTFNGFDAMRSLVEIINQTQNQIFWIISGSQHAWDYLAKSVQIEDYFHSVVRLGSMKTDAINSLIRKRNQIGGFKIIYVPPTEMQDYNKFKNASEDEQQNILEKRFFKKLNEFASNNISMALMYWLLSTKKVTDDQIMIGEFNNPDKSFIQVMTETRIFILLALILHDGLTLADLTLVNNQSPDIFRLQVSSLEENGIIITDGGLLKVNPLIYQNVVSVLKSKNLIH